MRRRLLMANSHAESNWVVTPNSGTYEDLCQYLINKYGYNFGSRKSPISINENVFLSGCRFCTDGIVTHLCTFDSSSATKCLLYTADHSNIGYAVRLYETNGVISADEYLYD